jgi:uncharacterized protein YukJ
LHDVHLNRGSTKGFIHRRTTTPTTTTWQDGAVLVDIGEPEWAAAFNQQLVPTDDLGNPLPGGTTI